MTLDEKAVEERIRETQDLIAKIFLNLPSIPTVNKEMELSLLMDVVGLYLAQYSTKFPFPMNEAIEEIAGEYLTHKNLHYAAYSTPAYISIRRDQDDSAHLIKIALYGRERTRIIEEEAFEKLKKRGQKK